MEGLVGLAYLATGAVLMAIGVLLGGSVAVAKSNKEEKVE